MNKLGYEDGQEEALQSERRQLSQQTTVLRDKVEELEARYSLRLIRLVIFCVTSFSREEKFLGWGIFL